MGSLYFEFDLTNNEWNLECSPNGMEQKCDSNANNKRLLRNCRVYICFIPNLYRYHSNLLCNIPTDVPMVLRKVGYIPRDCTSAL